MRRLGQCCGCNDGNRLKTPDADGVLANVRVLDLTDVDARLVGRLLADLGAEVVSVTATESAQNLAALLRGADVLIETLSNETARRLRLDPATVAEEYPHLIHVSVTPFGKAGPKANYAATDLTVTAAAGFLYLSGAPGDAPLRISEPQAMAHAAADAAVATMIALRARGAAGRGQHIDVAAQHSLTLALLSRGLDAAVGQPRAERNSGFAQVGAIRIRTLYPVRDGWVLVSAGILPPVAAFMRRLMSWAAEEGLCGKELIEWDWATAALQMLQGTITSEWWAGVERAIAGLLSTRTKAEVMAAAVQRKLLLAPVLHIGELLDSPQLVAREFVQRRAGRKPCLGAFARFEHSPLRRTDGPTKGKAGPDRWSPRRVPAQPAAAKPLAGLKVLDLFWVVAGPGATRMLADYGATVVHVESRNKLDMLRSVPPYVDGVSDPERAAGFHSTNANKLNISVDLATAAGRAVLTDLIRWADVFGESFSPGVVDRLGFGYPAVRELNPRLIMISSSLLGQSGPWRDYAGFGNLAGAISGFYQLTGLPGAPPTGCFGPYTDFMGVRFNALAILAALAHRDVTGEGQYIDMAQTEAALHFLAHAASAYLETGTVPEARGNHDDAMAPHGVFPAAGVDRWVAIAVRGDSEWQRLCRHAGWTEFAGDPTLATFAGRKSAESRIETALAAWTRTRAAETVEAELQQLDIPVHVLLDTHELSRDRQLVYRGFCRRVTHPQFGATTIEASRFHLSAAPAVVPTAAVSYGSHNTVVLRDMLGYSAERIEQLTLQGVLV
jgi:crotonobetainyl-CoA:carnitine CoA-transferase CaiB-like acyl-CoA transferase